VKYFLSAIVILLIFIVSVSAQIKNSKHDLSYNSTTTGPKTSTATYTEVCVFCHTPHSKESSSLLWNRTASSATYSVYSSPTMELTVPQPGAVSKNCLSCHDGTITFASVINNPGTGSGTAPVFAAPGKMDTITAAVPQGLGTNLTNDHPVGFVYNTSRTTDGTLRTETVSGIKVTVQATSPLRTLPLYGTTAATATLECGSCHNPHGVSGVSMFLRASNENSELCFTCHTK
jgi:predicted CXXCH cytochrome family protein